MRDEVNERKVATGAVPQFGRAYGEQVTIAAVQPQARDAGGGFHGKPRALKEDELHKLYQLAYVLPQMELRELVTPDDPVKVVVRVESAEMPGRVYGEAHSTPPELEIRDLETRIPFSRSVKHCESIFRRGLGFRRFEGRLRCRHNDKPIKLVLLKRILGSEKVAKMDGVKAPAEKSDFHVKNGKVLGLASPGKAQLPEGGLCKPPRCQPVAARPAQVWSEVSQRTNMRIAPTRMTGAIMLVARSGRAVQEWCRGLGCSSEGSSSAK